jgi:hypothetical protein
MALPEPVSIDRTAEFPNPTPRTETLFIVCHQTAGDGLESAITTLANRKLSYNFIVDKDGKIYKLVSAENKSGHSWEANSYSPSISLVGLNAKAIVDRAQTDRRQINAAVALGRWMQDKYKLPANSVYGHGEICLPGEKESTEGQYLAAILRNNQAPPPYPIPAKRFIDPKTGKKADPPVGKWTTVREAGFIVGASQNVNWQPSGTPNTEYFKRTYEEPLKQLTNNKVAQDFLKNIDSIKVNVNSQSLTLRQSVQGTANTQAIVGVNTLAGELTLLNAAAELNIKGQEEVRSVLSNVDGLLPAEAAYIVQQNLFEFFPDKMRQKMSISGAQGINANYAHAWRSPGKLAVTANITIPGASGFSIGQIFWIGRTYEHYKEEGAFQLFGLTENINMSRGWTTEIYSRFNAIPRTKVKTLTPV